MHKAKLIWRDVRGFDSAAHVNVCTNIIILGNTTNCAKHFAIQHENTFVATLDRRQELLK